MNKNNDEWNNNPFEAPVRKVSNDISGIMNKVTIAHKQGKEAFNKVFINNTPQQPPMPPPPNFTPPMPPQNFNNPSINQMPPTTPPVRPMNPTTPQMPTFTPNNTHRAQTPPMYNYPLLPEVEITFKETKPKLSKTIFFATMQGMIALVVIGVIGTFF